MPEKKDDTKGILLVIIVILSVAFGFTACGTQAGAPQDYCAPSDEAVGSCAG